MNSYILAAPLLVLLLTTNNVDADDSRMIKISRSMFKKFRFPMPQSNNAYWVYNQGGKVNIRSEIKYANLVEVINDTGSFRLTRCVDHVKILRYNKWESTLSCSDGSVTVTTAKDSLKAYVKSICTRQVQLIKYRYPGATGTVEVIWPGHSQICS